MDRYHGKIVGHLIHEVRSMESITKMHEKGFGELLSNKITEQTPLLYRCRLYQKGVYDLVNTG